MNPIRIEILKNAILSETNKIEKDQEIVKNALNQIDRLLSIKDFFKKTIKKRQEQIVQWEKEIEQLEQPKINSFEEFLSAIGAKIPQNEAPDDEDLEGEQISDQEPDTICCIVILD